MSALLAAVAATIVILRLPRKRQPIPLAMPALPAPALRSRLLNDKQAGEPGSGGFYGTWANGSPDAAVAEYIEFQYAGMEHQSGTALDGMWLFLATELLFFGGLFLIYVIYRMDFPHAFAIASNRTELVIGTVNTILLLTSSAVFSWGLGFARLGDNRRLFWACVAVMALGLAFLLLKGWEWKGDFDKSLFPGPHFPITGPDNGGAQIFWMFYFVATGLHGLHMIVGVGLVGWVSWAARKGRYSPGYVTPAEVVGLYWSFVDMVWLCLFPNDLPRRSHRVVSTRRTVLAWAALLVVMTVEIILAHASNGHRFVPFIGVGMAVVIALTFMGLAGSRGLIPIVAVIGVFWLCVMLGLGSLDSATRHDVFTGFGNAPSH